MRSHRHLHGPHAGTHAVARGGSAAAGRRSVRSRDARHVRRPRRDRRRGARRRDRGPGRDELRRGDRPWVNRTPRRPTDDDALMQSILNTIYIAAGLLIGLVAHEYARSWAAVRLGDHTPRSMGRLTLNPKPHV